MAKKGLTLEELKKIFPILTQELKKQEQSISITGVRPKSPIKEDWKGYYPEVIDFLRRCITIAEGLEIIAFLEGQQEITADYAKQLREQLQTQGIRSFGSRKEQDFYLKKSPQESAST